MHETADEWGDWLRAVGLAEATVRTRLGGLSSLCRHAGVADPREVTGQQVLGWLADNRRQWTRVTYYATASEWFDYCRARGWRDDDPLERVPKPKRPHGIPRPLSERVLRRLLADPPGHRAYAYLVLASFAGLRVHEIAKMRGEDIDAESGWMFVLGKGQQEAAVPMHPRVAMLAKGMPDVGFWFPGTHDGHVAPDSVSRVLRNAFRAVGSDATAHMCRHYFGTSVLRATGNVRVAQLALRHRSLGSTEIYTAVSNADLEAAIHSLGDVA